MLALEAIGAARFDPAGEVLLFERYSPFECQSDFGRQFVAGELRSKIYRADLESDAKSSGSSRAHSDEPHLRDSLRGPDVAGRPLVGERPSTAGGTLPYSGSSSSGGKPEPSQ